MKWSTMVHFFCKHRVSKTEEYEMYRGIWFN